MKKLIVIGTLFCGVSVFAQEATQPKSFSTNGKKVKVYTTADSTKYRLSQTASLTFADFDQPLETQPSIFVDPTHRFQTFLGIGGALTDAAAETMARLPEDKQAEVLRAYYDKENGIGYTIGRININSCDFSSDIYTYVADGDKELKTFNIAHDEKYKMPLVMKALVAAGGKLNLFVSPWSPPAWMKSNNDMLHGGSLKP